MILDEICAYKEEVVLKAKSEVPLSELEDQIKSARKPRDFRKSLRTEGISLIAEVKIASPSKGIMMEDADPVRLASIYEQCGANAVSVLTDEKYFQGSLNNMRVVERSIKLPVLRKEFIIDPYQIYEARAANADAILLIVRILTDEQLRDFRDLAESMGMGVLVETHDAPEIERALESGARIIGINNRDLSTFDVDYKRTLELKKNVPGGVVLVSESGINTREQVQKLEDGGVDAILVGEAFVTSENIAAKIREIMGTS
ncbi:MAG: indole-3-glycerol phosphate synthase [Candidatus Hydrogenedentota bacterium]|nr:MAG: indole-3-glycerol phosphate synthase [Candidatus Hydrogenedentota bacterium]PCJ65818.1 MAG: indole-3-glycerol phosphate synthase [Candidatus Hydrogenedentota bacterium]